MKGLLSVGGVALVLGVLLFAGRSQSEPQKPPAPRTRIGLINMGYVLKNYDKVDAYTKEMKAEFAQDEKILNKLKGEIEELTKKSQDKELSDDERDETAKQLKKLQRKQEDMTEKIKAELSKKTDKQMVTIYTDIRKASERYAKAHDLELVLHYIDVPTEADLDNPMNIMGKIQQRACFPSYMAPGLDISKEIVAELNKSLADEKVPPTDSK